MVLDTTNGLDKFKFYLIHVQINGNFGISYQCKYVLHHELGNSEFLAIGMCGQTNSWKSFIGSN